MGGTIDFGARAPVRRLPVAQATGGIMAITGPDAHSDQDLEPVLEHFHAGFHDREADQHRICYHGAVTGPTPAGLRGFDLDATPFQAITSTAERSMP